MIINVSSTNSRAVAAQILSVVLSDHISLTEALMQPISSLKETRDRRFVQELCIGVMRWLEELISILDCLLTRRLKTQDNDMYALLCIGLYQVLHSDTPAGIAVHAVVEASKTLKKKWAVPFINGVLRNFLRNQNEILKKVKANPLAEWAHPMWLLTALQKNYPDHWKSVALANNQAPLLVLRVNVLKVGRDTYLQKLTTHAIKYESFELNESPQAIKIMQSVAVPELPEFWQGEISVQDTAAQLAAYFLDAQANMRVIDACAAPGGKTAHILELQPHLEKLTVIDNVGQRLEKVKENLKRLALLSAQVNLVTADATKLNTWWDGKLVDRILLDAPCSGTGIIRRHPDIKFLRRASDVWNLTQLQSNLLTELWKVLKPGGILLYVTCSVLPEENRLLIQKFLNNHADAQLIPLVSVYGVDAKPGLQILPSVNGPDGFYYAKLGKLNSSSNSYAVQ